MECYMYFKLTNKKYLFKNKSENETNLLGSVYVECLLILALTQLNVTLKHMQSE